jgi:hypothetical protein
MFLGADVEGLDKVAKTCRDAAEFAQAVRQVLRAIVAAASIFGPWGKAFVAYLEHVVIPWLDRVIAALRAFAQVLSGNADAQRKVSAGESFDFATLPSYRTPALPAGDTHRYPVLPPATGGPAILPAPLPGGGAVGSPEPGAPSGLDPEPVTLPGRAGSAGSTGGDTPTADVTPTGLSGGGAPGGLSGGGGSPGGLGGGYRGSSGGDGRESGAGVPGDLTAGALGSLDPAAAGPSDDDAGAGLGAGTSIDGAGNGVNPVMVGGAGLAAGAGAGLLGASLLRRGGGSSNLDEGDRPLEPLRAGASGDSPTGLAGFHTGPPLLGAAGIVRAIAGKPGGAPWAGIGYGGEVPWETAGLSRHGLAGLALGLAGAAPAAENAAAGDWLALLPRQSAHANGCLGVVWPVTAR